MDRRVLWIMRRNSHEPTRDIFQGFRHTVGIVRSRYFPISNKRKLPEASFAAQGFQTRKRSPRPARISLSWSTRNPGYLRS